MADVKIIEINRLSVIIIPLSVLWTPYTNTSMKKKKNSLSIV